MNTIKFKVVNESVKKTDKHDARTLAEFLDKDRLPESKLCSQESEDIRSIQKSRSILVKSLVSLKKVLAELIIEDDNVRILMTNPGVGVITESTIRAYVDDITRYDSAKKFAAHCGLVPWVQNSNMTIHHGHITKRSPMELRTAMVQVVMGMIRSRKHTTHYNLLTKYENMKRYKGSGQYIIAMAKKMSTIIYRMLKNREDFDSSKMNGNEEYKDMQAAALEAVKAS